MGCMMNTNGKELLKALADDFKITYPDFIENSVYREDKGIRVKIGHKNSACIIEGGIK